jgi:hypothetical protein
VKILPVSGKCPRYTTVIGFTTVILIILGNKIVLKPVLWWIRIGFNADLDPGPAFYLSADLEPDPDPVPTLKSQKVEFLHEKCT